jgi:hypothetical protein
VTRMTHEIREKAIAKPLPRILNEACNQQKIHRKCRQLNRLNKIDESARTPTTCRLAVILEVIQKSECSWGRNSTGMSALNGAHSNKMLYVSNALEI